jgi:hypothetical protein
VDYTIFIYSVSKRSEPAKEQSLSSQNMDIGRNIGRNIVDNVIKNQRDSLPSSNGK